MIDESKLDELLALADKATPGSRTWSFNAALPFSDAVSLNSDDDTIISAGAEGYESTWLCISSDDQGFIAACDPETIKALVDEVKRLRTIALDLLGEMEEGPYDSDAIRKTRREVLGES